MTALVGDRASQRVSELGVGIVIAGFEHLEDGERHSFQDDVLTNDAGDKVAIVDLLEEDFGELHEIRIHELIDRRFQVVLLHTEVVEALREDLDMAGLVECLRREEPLARIVGSRVDQP